jgi:Ca2+/H+ antiporter, TMEM165/GDT1 family
VRRASLDLPGGAMDASSALGLFAAAYAAVLAAELVGDKVVFAVGAFGTRYDARTVLLGLVPAFAVKSLAAVLLGGLLATLPGGVLRAITVAGFVATAVVLWRRTAPDGGGATPSTLSSGTPARGRPSGKGALVIFGALASTEWGDVGQFTTAAIAARSHAPALVWLAATLALTTKGLVALAVGAQLRRHVSPTALRYGAVLLCLTLGVLTVTITER